MADLLRAWKIPSSIVSTDVTRPEPIVSPKNWVTDDDYPMEALAQGLIGEVTFRLNIDSAGNPSECAVVVGSGHPILNGAVCPLMMKRARFKPARTTDGTAIPYVYLSRFTWRIQ